MKTAKERRYEEIKARIKKMYPTEDDLIDGMMTMLGMSASFTIYVSNSPLLTLPYDITYAIAITSANMYALTNPDMHADFEQKVFGVIESMNEQTEEEVRRRLVWIVKMLHEQMIKDEEI